MASSDEVSGAPGAAALLGALEKVGKKRQLDPTPETLNEISALLDAWEGEDVECQDGPARASALQDLRKKLGEFDARVMQTHHKELAASITKLGKAADKMVGVSVESAVPPENLSFEVRLINQAIHHHHLVSGRFDVAHKFAEACDIEAASALEAALR